MKQPIPTFEQLPSPPTIADHIWRAMRHEDAPALQRLEARCAEDYGNRMEATVDSCAAKLAAAEDLNRHSLCAIDAAGVLAAAGIVSFRTIGPELRFSLDGNVAPEHCGQGVGSYLLRWMEETARQTLTTRTQNHHAVLSIDFYDRRERAIPLFEAHGFQLRLTECDLRRGLDGPLPDCELPTGLTFADWTPNCTAAAFAVYQEAFRERPGFPDWPLETWRSIFIDCEEFKADLTVLVFYAGSPIAYAICHIAAPLEEPQQQQIGWIAQLGVAPAWRRRGVASAMLAEAMRRFRAAGLATTALEVNVNNPQALSAYRQLGYEHYSQYTSYRKAV